MATRSTFQGIIRTYGGQDKSSGVTPAPVIVGEVVSFLSSTATATALEQCLFYHKVLYQFL
jgi:hypothetical protein